MAIDIQGSNVTEVLLDTGWVRVRDFRVQSVNAAGVKWPTAATFETESGYTTVPASSVLGVRGSRPKSSEQLEAERVDAQAKADALLRWRTFAPDRETFDRLSAGQGGKCKGCGVLLSEARHVHYVITADGPALFCHHGIRGLQPV